MKIISNSIEGWSLELMCKGCNSLLEIEAGDVRCAANFSYSRVPKKDRHNYHIICPVCDSRTKLENLPKPVEIKAQHRKDIDVDREDDVFPGERPFDREKDYY